LAVPALRIPTKNSQPLRLKTATCSDALSATYSGPKTDTNSDMITPVVNGGFWKRRIVAIDPNLTVALLQSGQSDKSAFCELDGQKAVIGDLTQPANTRLSSIRRAN
jgi:hypothetical protein